MRKLLLIGVFTLGIFATKAQSQHNIIPKPQSYQQLEGNFLLEPPMKLWFSGFTTNTNAVRQIIDSAMPITQVYKAKKSNLVIELDTHISHEGYRLRITPKGIQISISSNAGLHYALMSMFQIGVTNRSDSMLLFFMYRGGKVEFNNGNATPRSKISLPCIEINDEPRFAYRGMHLDISRHFQNLEFVLKYAAMANLYRFNVIHLHLTDDQGWRFESKIYPKLNGISSMRYGSQVGPYGLHRFDTIMHGGIYKQTQLRTMVNTLNHGNITVIPEIEMPGHAMAALAAYPELSCVGGVSGKTLQGKDTLFAFEVAREWGVFDDVFCAGNEQTFTFLQTILKEVMETFPNSPYIHIGGDECPKERWKHCAKCQQRMKDLGLKDEHELQSYFIKRIERFLQDSGWYYDMNTGEKIKGRNIIGWDEILEGGLAAKATVMSWRGTEGGIAAAKQHHNAIMTPGKPLYFDHYQSQDSTEPHAIGGYNPVEDVYNYDPIPTGLPDSLHRYILGAQGNVWTEYMTTSKHIEYMTVPRMQALAETLWTAPEKKNYDDFVNRLSAHRAIWQKMDWNYAPQIFGEAASWNRNGNKTANPLTTFLTPQNP